MKPVLAIIAVICLCAAQDAPREVQGVLRYSKDGGGSEYGPGTGWYLEAKGVNYQLGLPFIRSTGKSEVLEKCKKLKDREVVATVRPAASVGDEVISWLLKDIKEKKK